MGRTTKLLFGLIAVVGVAPVGFLILDSAGRPEHQDSCEVVSTLFSQGTTTTDYIDAGNHVSVPIRREIPGSWGVKLKCSVLGVRDISSDEQPKVGQHGTIKYAIGRFSGTTYLEQFRPQQQTDPF